MEFREVCQRCRRPTSVCFCGQLVEVPTRTRVVFLQHPRERYVAIGTARMAHLSLPNSEIHLGVDFADNSRVNAVAADSGTAVLFPGPGAADPRSMGPNGPKHLIVVDGTWPQAKKVIDRNPVLRRLPRVGLTPRRPG
ncbi:MAG: tRNA-uridine aminocarboxypropyltransferase, partial [Myxococcaceae bacterium]